MPCAHLFDHGREGVKLDGAQSERLFGGTNSQHGNGKSLELGFLMRQ